MQIIGHRGCSVHFPENTRKAIRGAAPHVDMIEIDVRRCGSGEIVVFHDERVDRLTSGSGRVSDHSYEELAALRVADSDEPIPTLSLLLDALPAGTGINIELKHAGMAEDLRPLIEGRTDIIISSFQTDALSPLRDEGVPLAYLFADTFFGNLETAAALGCAFVHPLHEIADRETITAAHDREIGVNAWTVPTAAAVSRLRDAGIDGVIVDSWELVPDTV